jgi:hypothetical protein
MTVSNDHLEESEMPLEEKKTGRGELFIPCSSTSTNMGRSLGLMQTAVISMPIFWALVIFKQHDDIQIDTHRRVL